MNRKSGIVKIKLGPRDVEAILEKPIFKRLGDYSGSERAIASKLYRAVSEQFAKVKLDMTEELRARDIVRATRESKEWKTLQPAFKERRDVANKLLHELSGEEAVAIQKVTQDAFDKAGITHFRASGYGWRQVKSGEKNDTN